jgi:hypothetical protein
VQEELEIQEQSPKREDSQQSNYYPRAEGKQPLSSNCLKWSHQHLSSKIREVQFLRHEEGHIRALHVRY